MVLEKVSNKEYKLNVLEYLRSFYLSVILTGYLISLGFTYFIKPSLNEDLRKLEEERISVIGRRDKFIEEISNSRDLFNPAFADSLRKYIVIEDSLSKRIEKLETVISYSR